jgi:hypothetical protein
MNRLAAVARRDQWTIAAVIGAAIVTVVGFIVLAGATETPAAAFLASVLATFVGITAGLPAGLLISDRDRSAQREHERRDRDTQADGFKRQIAFDLRETRDQLLVPIRQPRRQGVTPFLGTGLWNAVKASAAVRLLDDPAQLYAVSRAYDRIALTAYLERMVWELMHNPTARLATDPPQTLIRDAIARVEEQDGHTKAAIEHALSLLPEPKRSPA